MPLASTTAHSLFIDAHADYPAWRQHFLINRLYLGLMLALWAILSFSTLNAFRYFSGGTFQPDWAYAHTLQALALLACLGYLYHPRVHAGVALLLFSSALTLLPQGIGLLQGYTDFNLALWSMVFMGQATLAPVYWRLHALSQMLLLGVVLYLHLGLGLALHSNTLQVTDAFFYLLYMVWFASVCTLAVFLYERLQRQEFEVRHQLKHEQEKSERLLLNILPSPIAERLKTTEGTIADDFTEVSVLFTDLVGFTELSARLDPPHLVYMLNQVFSRFDQLVEKHGLEKIKTIGDAYMVVAGLPESLPDHADRIAQLALEMRQAIRDFDCQQDIELTVRIGIHSGPVVAGVIGIKKFAYDLWGDTVNVASRMESHGKPGEIQISAAFYQALKQQYQVESRGTIKIKGKGDMQTYFLHGLAPSASGAQ